MILTILTVVMFFLGMVMQWLIERVRRLDD
jgi:hypothetical protein